MGEILTEKWERGVALENRGFSLENQDFPLKSGNVDTYRCKRASMLTPIDVRGRQC